MSHMLMYVGLCVCPYVCLSHVYIFCLLVEIFKGRFINIQNNNELAVHV